MKIMSRFSSIILFALLCLCNKSANAQFYFPSDTTTYWLTNESGVEVPVQRGLDNMILKGQLIIRFREGALDYGKLMQQYTDWYFDPYKAHHGKGGGQIQSYPFLPCDSDRGFPDSLRYNLKTTCFYFDSSNNIVRDSSLKHFLLIAGGHYLRRLTTASPADKYSITRRGDTIGCDHYNWMLLNFDTTTSSLILSYLLTTEFSNDVFFAEPDYQGAVMLRHPNDSHLLHDKCQWDQDSMIHTGQAWDYEIGNPKIILSHFDFGVDYMDSDLSGGIGAGFHVKAGAQFSVYNGHVMDDIRLHQGHGTPCMGIMGALTNRNPTSVAGIAGGWGVLPTDSLGSVDQGTGCSLVILAASKADYSDLTAALFEASARSDSSNYGFGVHLVNTCIDLFRGSSHAGDSKVSLHGAVNFAFLNGVVQTAAMGESNNQHANGIDESIDSVGPITWPVDYEEPWMIAVGGSQPNRTRIPTANYGNTMDLIAPAGDPTNGDDMGTDLLGYHYKCSNSNDGGNWNETFTIANVQHDSVDMEITHPLHTFRGFGGTSASAPHVAGSAGLLLSYFINDTLNKLEPEDVAGILKASAYRPAGVLSWQKQTGWGHLDIGHAFQMFDQTPARYTDNMYFLRHYHFDDNLDSSSWSPDSSGYFFQICYSPNIQDRVLDTTQNFTTMVKNSKWQFLLANSGFALPTYYYAKVRTISRKCYIDSSHYDITSDAPLFAWGRSAGNGSKSGWSFAKDNWETGWSRIADGKGGDPLGMNEGIFHSDSTTFVVITAQYDVWAFDSATQKPTIHIGHIPADSMMGVNFTVFGRRNLAYSSVKHQSQSSGNQSLIVSVNLTGDRLNAQYLTDQDIEHPKMEIYDILGRLMETHTEDRANVGWNTITSPLNQLASGTYICRVSGSGFTQSKSFHIFK